MNWKELFRPKKRVEQTKASQAGPMIAWSQVGRPKWTPRRYENLAEEGFRKNVIAYRCVSLIASAAANVPWNLYGRSGHEIDRHPLLDLLDRPNPLQDGVSFLEGVFVDLLIAGNAYIEAVVPQDGATPSELYVLRPDRMKVIPGAGGLPQGYEYNVNGKTTRWSVDPLTGRSAVLHIKTHHPLDDWYGMAPLEAALLSIDQHNAASTWNQALLNQGARPSGALVFAPKDGTGTLSDEQMQHLREELDQHYTGRRSAGRPMILEGGLDWREMSLSPKDMDWLAGRDAAARDIALAFGVPVQLIGIQGAQTYANMQEARLALYEETVIPLLSKVLGAIDQWLTPLYDEELYLDFDRDEISALTVRRDVLWEKLQGANFLTVNEKRAALYDVSALEDVTVDGLSVSDHASAAETLQVLQTIEPFDLVESDGILRAVRRGQAQACALTDDDMNVVPEGQAAEKGSNNFAITRIQDLALPIEVTVDTLDALRDYEVGSQRARRLFDTGDQRTTKVALPVVCTPTQTKRIAERILYTLWAERSRFRFYLTRVWADVEPGDVLSYDGETMRVVATSMQDGVIRVDAVSSAADGLSSANYAESGTTSASGALHVVPSYLYLMDLPLLRDEDDQSGVYVAASGRDGWTGASLWKANDGVNFTEQTVFSQPVTAGSAVTVLADKSIYYKDNESILYVQLYQGSLASCTEAQLLGGANVALCGGEIVQFQTAALLGPGYYALSGLLRGRRGTEDATNTHMAGEDFVLLDRQVVQFVPLSSIERGEIASWRAVSNGQSIGAAQERSLAPGFRTIEPRAPVHITASRTAGAGSDLTLSWKRRARKDNGWLNYVDMPLDETSEIYDVEVIKDGVPVRSFTDVQTTSLVYTAAEQTADWGASIPASFTFYVYQKSDRFGRGQRAVATV